MTTKEMSKALDAIHDEAMRVLQKDLPEDVRSRLELIVSLARYKFVNDVSISTKQGVEQSE